MKVDIHSFIIAVVIHDSLNIWSIIDGVEYLNNEMKINIGERHHIQKGGKSQENAENIARVIFWVKVAHCGKAEHFKVSPISFHRAKGRIFVYCGKSFKLRYFEVYNHSRQISDLYYRKIKEGKNVLTLLRSMYWCLLDEFDFGLERGRRKNI